MSDDAQVSESGDAPVGDAPAADDASDSQVGSGFPPFANLNDDVSDASADDGADEVDEDEAEDGDPVVQALIAALRSGNAGDAENAIVIAAEAGHDVSAFGNVPIQGKRDLAALEAEAIEAADEAAEEAEEEDDEDA